MFKSRHVLSSVLPRIHWRVKVLLTYFLNYLKGPRSLDTTGKLHFEHQIEEWQNDLCLFTDVLHLSHIEF